MNNKKKQILYMSQSQGIKELDLILYKYTKSNIDNMPESELDIFYNLLNQDPFITYMWIFNKESPDYCYQKIIKDIIKKI